jgi:polyhydroxyalkanoate synthesis regulator phasin
MKEFHGDRSSIVTALRRAMQFSVGSLLILQEKSDQFVQQAIERGQEAQEEGRKLVQEIRAEQKHKRPQRIDPLEVRINQALARLGVPSKQDVDELNRHIDELGKHLDELSSSN